MLVHGVAEGEKKNDYSQVDTSKPKEVLILPQLLNTIDDVEINNTNGYGIGIQEGTNKNVRINNVHILHTDKDGIDVKNVNDDNDSILISNVNVEYWNEDVSDTAKAAIDIRGPAVISNAFINHPGATNATGIRFRNGELGSDNGLGGHGSSVSNFHIDMSSATGGVGVAKR